MPSLLFAKSFDCANELASINAKTIMTKNNLIYSIFLPLNALDILRSMTFSAKGLV